MHEFNVSHAIISRHSPSRSQEVVVFIDSIIFFVRCNFCMQLWYVVSEGILAE